MVRSHSTNQLDRRPVNYFVILVIEEYETNLFLPPCCINDTSELWSIVIPQINLIKTLVNYFVILLIEKYEINIFYAHCAKSFQT